MNEEQFKEWLKREMPEGTVIGNPEWWAKKIWQAALSAKSVPEQMGSPIQKLMEYLTNILDEDEFNQCDSILAGQGISAPKPTDDSVRELESLVDCLLEADMTAQLNGGGAHARHTMPAILELRKFRAKHRAIASMSSGEQK